MKEGQKYAVWLTDEAARAFLGIDAKQPQSRWVVLGECTGEESGVGFWVHVDHIEQWMAVGDSRTITVSPPACLIPYHLPSHARARRLDANGLYRVCQEYREATALTAVPMNDAVSLR